MSSIPICFDTKVKKKKQPTYAELLQNASE